MNPLMVAVSAFLLAAPPGGTVGSAPGGNVGSAPGGNVGRAPGGNVGMAPTGGVGRAPGGNVGFAPGGNVGFAPGGNVGQFPGGNVGNLPRNPLVGNFGPSRANAKGKSKNDPFGDSTSKKGSDAVAKGKKDADRKKKESKAGVDGPWVVGGPTAPSGGVIAELEDIRILLNSIGNDFQGRRTAAVVQVTHAISMLRYGHSDPNPQASVVPALGGEPAAVSNGKMLTANGRLWGVADRLRTNAYFHSSAALAAVQRAMNALGR